jgi:hypothetical protein
LAEEVPAVVADCLTALASEAPEARGGAPMAFAESPFASSDEGAIAAASPEAGFAACAGFTVLEGAFVPEERDAIAVAGQGAVWLFARAGAAFRLVSRLAIDGELIVLLRPVEGRRFADPAHRARPLRTPGLAPTERLLFYALALRPSEVGLSASLHAVTRDRSTMAYRARHVLDHMVARR